MKSKGRAAVGFNCCGLSLSMEREEGRKIPVASLLSSAHGTGNADQNWQMYDNN